MAHDLSKRAVPPQLSRRTFLAAAAAAPLAATVACGDDGGNGGAGGTGGDAKTGTIAFANWADTEDATRPGFQDLMTAFQGASPDITVKSEGIAFSDIGQQLVQRVQAGNPPDLAQISGNDTFVLAATDALAPLDDLLPADVISAVNESDIETGTFDGKLLAFPWSDSPQGFWYNKKLMEQAGLDPEQPPATIADLTTALAAIKKQFPDITVLGLDTTNRSFGLAANWAWMSTFGAEPFSGADANADTPEMQEYLAWMQELAQKGYIDPGKKIGEFRPLGAQDGLAFMWDQDVFQGVVQSVNAMPDAQFYDTWGVSLPPAGPSGAAGSVNLGHQLIIFNQSKARGAAAKLVEYLATDEQAILDFTMGTNLSMPPLTEPQGEVAEALDNPIRQTFISDIIPAAITPPYGPTFSQGYGPVMAGVQQAVTSQLAPEEITAEMQNQLEAVLG